MRLLVCGSREWTNKEAIRNKILKLKPEVVIQGAARGADLLAEEVAKEEQIDYLGFPAKWKTHKRAAGPIRNRHQFDIGKPDRVIAFHEDLDNSKGTKDMVLYAISQGCPVEYFDNKFWRKLQ